MRRFLLTACCCLVLPALGGCSVWGRLTGQGQFAGRTPLDVRIRAVPNPDLAPPDPAAIVNRLYARAADAIRARDYALALDLLQVAAARAPGDVRVLNAQGVVYDELGRFDLSGRYYARALQADPNSAIVANNIAYSARLQGLKASSPTLQAAAPPPVSAPAPAPVPSGASSLAASPDPAATTSPTLPRTKA
jgi:tetratricopeptide (TPR) repeat protein